MYSGQALKMGTILMGRNRRGGCCEMSSRVHRGTWVWGVEIADSPAWPGTWHSCRKVMKDQVRSGLKQNYRRALNAMMRDLTLEEKVSIFCGLLAMISWFHQPCVLDILWIRWIRTLLDGFTTECINGTGGVQHQSQTAPRCRPWFFLLDIV